MQTTFPSRRPEYKNPRRNALREAQCQRRIKMVMEMKGNRCKRCGYESVFAVYDFHHRDPKNKKFGVNVQAFRNRSEKAILEEAEKCDMLCANCHREVHHEMRTASRLVRTPITTKEAP